MANHINDATKYLLESLERDLFLGLDYKHKNNLHSLLGKLGIKSARVRGPSLFGGGPLKIESLEATLKQVSFDAKHLSLWKSK